MNPTTQFSIVITLLVMSEVAYVTARYERVGYISDPIQLLVKNGYSPLRNGNYVPIKRPWRPAAKRRYPTLPPSFYSTFGSGSNPMDQRHMVLPYNDLLFNGR